MRRRENRGPHAGRQWSAEEPVLEQSKEEAPERGRLFSSDVPGYEPAEPVVGPVSSAEVKASPIVHQSGPERARVGPTAGQMDVADATRLAPGGLAPEGGQLPTDVKYPTGVQDPEDAPSIEDVTEGGLPYGRP